MKKIYKVNKYRKIVYCGWLLVRCKLKLLWDSIVYLKVKVCNKFSVGEFVKSLYYLFIIVGGVKWCYNLDKYFDSFLKKWNTKLLFCLVIVFLGIYLRVIEVYVY